MADMVKVIYEGSFNRRARGDFEIVTEAEAEDIARRGKAQNKTVKIVSLAKATKKTKKTDTKED